MSRIEFAASEQDVRDSCFLVSRMKGEASAFGVNFSRVLVFPMVYGSNTRKLHGR